MQFFKFVLCVFIALNTAHLHAQSSADTERSREEQQKINQIVIEAFEQTHEGWSSDEVTLQDDLHEAFVSHCRNHATNIAKPVQWNWTLMNLRKAGKLKVKTTKRKRTDLSGVRHIAEIVTRSMTDKHQCSIDRLICDSELRNEFDAMARSFEEKIDTYSVRKAAFQLRKTRKLRPELIGRIADWGRKIESFDPTEILKDPTVLSERPGIYIFRDSTGYLYIGQTENLRERLVKHLDDSHNASLSNYLKSESGNSISIEVHTFDPKSNASKTRYRRAYESELIASRKPRFNLQP